MKEETKKLLDQIQRQERKRNIIPALCAVLGLTVLTITIFTYLYAPGESIEVFGVLTGLYGEPTPQTGEILYFLVRLDDGKIIKTRKPSGIIFQKGKRVIITETTTLIFGMKHYAFKGYSGEEKLK